MFCFSLASWAADQPTPAAISKFLLVPLLMLIIASRSASASEVDELVVTAKGQQSLADVLATSHVLDAADIAAAQARDLASLLDQISSIVITDSGGRGSDTGVFLRGASRAQTIVLIDGARVGSATLGLAALNTYPIEAIERIEVVKGPMSGIYGADALGGVIQLFTRKGSEGRGEVSISAGSNALQEYALSLSGGSNRNSWFVSAHSEQGDGIDRTSITSGGNDDIDGFEETAFTLGAQAQLTSQTVATASLLYSENSVDFDNTFGDDTGYFSDTESLGVTLGISSALQPALLWNTTVGANKDEVTTPAFFSEFATERHQLSSELVFDLGADRVLTLGADHYREDIKTLSDFPVNERDNTGAFFQFQTNSGRYGMVASLRYDDNSAYGDDTNGSLALSYQLNDQVRLVASHGTAFVAPSFNDLYFPFFGNPDLLPEESTSSEVSLQGNYPRLSWRLAAYRTDIDNLFSFDPVTFLAANIGQAQIEGIELEMATRLFDWDVQVAADLLSAQDRTNSTELDDRAEQSINLQATRQWQNLAIRLAMRAESGRFDLRGTELSSFALFDIGARYQLANNWSLDAKLENLFDRDYTVNLISASERYRTEGRLARVTVRYGF